MICSLADWFSFSCSRPAVVEWIKRLSTNRPEIRIPGKLVTLVLRGDSPSPNSISQLIWQDLTSWLYDTPCFRVMVAGLPSLLVVDSNGHEACPFYYTQAWNVIKRTVRRCQLLHDVNFFGNEKLHVIWLDASESCFLEMHSDDSVSLNGSQLPSNMRNANSLFFW